MNLDLQKMIQKKGKPKENPPMALWQAWHEHESPIQVL